MQTADFDRERKNLQELISRLEVHLSEQTKLVEEVQYLLPFFVFLNKCCFFLFKGTMESIASTKTYGSYARRIKWRTTFIHGEISS